MEKGWLAGFIDGEGCFGFSRVPYFAMGLTVGSKPYLDRVQWSLGGVGAKNYRSRKYTLGNSHPAIQLYVTARDDLKAVIWTLDEIPLQLKREDYLAWKPLALEYVDNPGIPVEQRQSLKQAWCKYRSRVARTELVLEMLVEGTLKREGYGSEMKDPDCVQPIDLAELGRECSMLRHVEASG